MCFLYGGDRMNSENVDKKVTTVVRQPAGLVDAVYGLGALATSARVVWPGDVQTIHHALFETTGGQQALEMIERGLGLALVPVERVV